MWPVGGLERFLALFADAEPLESNTPTTLGQLGGRDRPTPVLSQTHRMQ